MGRRSVVVTLFAAFAVWVTACGGDDVETTGQADHSSADAAEVEAVTACPPAGTPAPELLETGVVFEHADAGNDHVACDEGFTRAPPTSGAHFDAWQNCGFYTEPVRDYTAVHALEHGAVWIAYRPDLDPATLTAIEERVAADTHLLAAPYPGLRNPLVLSAWTRQLAVDDWADPAVETFLDDYTGRLSSTAPEAGVSCEGAVGLPPTDPDANLATIFDQIA